MKHALIIEDRIMIAIMIEQLLAECGYGSAQIAVSQDEAISFAQQRCPDLITADDRLASGSGIEAVREICRHQAIPVIFISGDAEQIRQTIPDAVIVEKPFTHAPLRSAIPAAVKSARIYS